MWSVAAWEDLYQLVLLGAKFGSVTEVGLHHCGGEDRVTPGGRGPKDVLLQLEYARTLMLQVRERESGATDPYASSK